MGAGFMALREKVIASVAGCLLLVLGLSATYNAISIRRLAARQAAEATGLAASSINSAMAVFGETGDMNGLTMYLKNVSALPALADVHAVRAPSVAAEMGPRADSGARDEIDQRVLASGQQAVVVDHQAHTRRTVSPVKAQDSCVACHTGRKAGDVLGLASVTLRTAESDAAVTRATLAAVVSAVIALLVAAGALAFLINRLVIAPVRAVAGRLLEDVSALTDAATQLSQTSGQMVDGANNQAASLEESSASLETMASQTRANASTSGERRPRVRQTSPVSLPQLWARTSAQETTPSPFAWRSFPAVRSRQSAR